MMQMAESSPNKKKTLWEKEKLLVTSNFSFSHNVFKRLALLTCKNQGLFGKRLKKPTCLTYLDINTDGEGFYPITITTVRNKYESLRKRSLFKTNTLTAELKRILPNAVVRYDLYG